MSRGHGRFYPKPGPGSEKNMGAPNIWIWIPRTPRLPSPDTVGADTHSSHHRHFLRTRTAMQNCFHYSLIIISIFLACYHVAKNEKKNCQFVGAPVRPNMLKMPKTASARGPLSGRRISMGRLFGEQMSYDRAVWAVQRRSVRRSRRSVTRSADGGRGTGDISRSGVHLTCMNSDCHNAPLRHGSIARLSCAAQITHAPFTSLTFTHNVMRCQQINILTISTL